MAGLRNALDLSAWLRRLGVKSPTANLPIVPGIFPTVQLRDTSTLVGMPKESSAFMSALGTIPAPGSQLICQLTCPGPFIVKQIWCAAGIVNQLFRVLKPGEAPPLETHSLPVKGELDTVGVVGSVGEWFARGADSRVYVNWYFDANAILQIESMPMAGASGYQVIIGVEWTELPASTVEE